MKQKYTVEFVPDGIVRKFSNRRKADQDARKLSRAVYGIVCLRQDRQIIGRYSNGAITLYRS